VVGMRKGLSMKHTPIDNNVNYVVFVQPGDKIFCKDIKDFNNTLHDVVSMGVSVLVTPELMRKYAFEVKEVPEDGT